MLWPHLYKQKLHLIQLVWPHFHPTLSNFMQLNLTASAHFDFRSRIVVAPVDGLARCGLHVSPVQINGRNPHMHFQINTAFVDLSNMPSIFILCKLLFSPTRIFCRENT